MAEQKEQVMSASFNSSFTKDALTRVNILLVDDRPDGLMAMEAVLSSDNYNLVKAASGREALEYLWEYDFAVILLDVQMPEMDGFETAELIRKYPACKETPIIFITAISQDHQHIYRGYESGAVDYLFKPLDDFILRSKVKVFVDLYKKNRKIREQANLLREMELREKDRLREELEIENLRRYGNLANAIPHIVFRSCRDGEIEYLNQAWYDAYVNEDFSLENFKWHSVVHPADRSRVIRKWLSHRHQRGFQMEARIKDKAGIYRWHLISLVMEQRDGDTLGWLGTCIDIQDQKNRENEFRLLTENLNRSNQGLEQFAYIASHDLQEPLRKIITFTELIRDNPFNMTTPQKDYLNRIYRSGYRMKSVIEDLLQYSRISRIAEYRREEVDLSKIVKEVLYDLEVAITLSGARVTVSPLPIVEGDAVQLRLLFQNLISNAIKFSQKGHVPKIILKVRNLKGGGKEIRMLDNGIGFEKKYAGKIFEPFQRLHGKGEYEGTGIGLSIVRKIVDHHGWDIRVDSKVGTGTTFIISIPD